MEVNIKAVFFVSFPCVFLVTGGAFFQIDYPYDEESYPDRTIDIGNTKFVRNNADRAAGGLFIDRGNALDTRHFECSHDPHVLEDFSSEDGIYANTIHCGQMKDNSVDENGYGQDVATAAVSFYLTVMYEDGPKNYSIGDTVRIPENKSGSLLPDLKVTVFDHLHQGPALTKSQNLLDPLETEERLVRYDAFVKATVDAADTETSGSLIKNPLIADLRNGTGIINLGDPFQIPGDYSLILWIEDDKSRNITIEVTLRECTINEESERDGTLCNECDSNHYNFDPKNGICETCPDDCS